MHSAYKSSTRIVDPGFVTSEVTSSRNMSSTPYYLRNSQSYKLQIWQLYSHGTSEQKPVKNLREKGVWAYPGTAHFFQHPLLSQERAKLRTSNLTRVFTVFIRPKGFEKFVRKGSVGVSRDCPIFFPVHPIISGMRRATNFKFGTYIHRVYPTKSLLKIWEKRERWRIQGLPNFLKYPLLFQERLKLRTSNLPNIFTASM